MNQDKQAEALRLAEYLEQDESLTASCDEAAAELRRLHARIAELEAELAAVQQDSDYKTWYEEAMIASNEAGFVGMDAASTIRALAATHPTQQVLDALTPAARDVLSERKRQIESEGWKVERDDVYDTGEMALAAACYAAHSASCAAIRAPHTAPGVFVRTRSAQDFVVEMWPWSDDWWKPSDHRRNLEKAGALILAEIERIDRAALAAQAKQGEQ